MPHFQRTLLFSTEGLQVARVSCDGDDGRRPAEEHATRDHAVLVLRGRFTFRDRWTHAVVSPARAMLLRSGSAYTIAHPHGDGDECLAIAGAAVAPLFEASRATRNISAGAYARVQRLLHRLAAGRRVDPLAFEEALYAALSEDHGSPQTSGRDRAVADAIAYSVELRFGERLPLVRLASLANVSVFHACRIFHRVMGISIHRYQQEMRLRHALSLLLDAQMPLAQIALEAGFANQGHFSNAFRRRFGLTPGQTRAPGAWYKLGRQPARGTGLEA